jgi:hypothetical protein
MALHEPLSFSLSLSQSQLGLSFLDLIKVLFLGEQSTDGGGLNTHVKLPEIALNIITAVSRLD